MGYRPHPKPTVGQLLYDPVRDLPHDHLARLVERVVEETIRPKPRSTDEGQPPFDPRLCLKVLIYGYATGTRSSRQLERLCHENLAYLFLTRGDAPSYHTLSTARLMLKEEIEAIWIGLFAVAAEVGMKRIGHIVVDSTKLRANASPEAVLKRAEYAAVRKELEQILAAAQQVDQREDQEGYPGKTKLEQTAKPAQMRDILRRVRKRLAQEKRKENSAKESDVSTKEPPKPPRPRRGKRTGKAQGAPTPTDNEQNAASGNEPTLGPEAPTPGVAATEAEEVPPTGAEGAPPTLGASQKAEGADPLARPSGENGSEPKLGLTSRMRERLRGAIEALAEAEAEERKHCCLTDPDARMMPEGREKKIRECHCFEAAVDREDGLLVVGQMCQEGNDNQRLETLVEAAAEQEPEGVRAVDGDSGYYQGDALGRLMAKGIDCCVPDTHTACDLHRGLPIGSTRQRTFGSRVELIYDAERDLFVCPEGNELRRESQAHEHGQEVTIYKAQRLCRGCPRAEECLMQKRAKYRTVKVGRYQKELEAAQQRFAEAEHQERYRHRGEAIETVFGFMRGTLGYVRMLLRGKEKVGIEGSLMKVGYQLRKIQAEAVGG